jgi:predicted dehydrogenase
LHLDGYRQLESRVRIDAVCDADPERAAQIASATGARAATFDEIVADPDVDAVEILVPSSVQAELGFRAIAAGKHVTLQKPLAGDLQTGHDLVDAARRGGVHLRVFENTVNAPAWRLAESLIADGAIGRPLSMYLRWANSLLPCGWDVPSSAWAWRHTGAWADQFAAPSLFDDSAHLLSPAVALFGRVREVVALSGEQRVGDRVTGFPYSIAWHHEGGGQAVVEGSLCDDLVILTDEYSADTSIVITGSSGLLWINTGEGRAAERPTVEVASKGTLTTFDADHRWSASWPLAQREWIDTLEGRGSFRWTGEHALLVLEGSLLVDEAVRAARVRRAASEW